MCGTNDHIFVRGVPCALRRYIDGRSDDRAFGVASPYACKVNFQDWVKTFRQISPNIEMEELVMCPMLWCRKVLNSPSSVEDHIRSCDRLSDGWYWCPMCRRPERFLECDQSCGTSQRPLPQRKGSRLHRAASFFSSLGRKQQWREDTAKRNVAEIENDLVMNNFIAEGWEKAELDVVPDYQMLVADLMPSKDMKAALLVNEKGSSFSEYGNDVMFTTAPTGPSFTPHLERGSLQEMPAPFIGSPQSFRADFTFNEGGGGYSPRRSDLMSPNHNFPYAELPGSRRTTSSLPRLNSSIIFPGTRPSELAETFRGLATRSDASAGVVSPIEDDFREAPNGKASSPLLLSPVSDSVALTSPSSTLVEQAVRPGGMSHLWRMSIAPDPLLVSKQLGLRTNSYTPIAVTTTVDPCVDRYISFSHAGPDHVSEHMFWDPFVISAETSPSTSDSTWTCSPIPTHTQVKELRDLVGIVNSEWMQRILPATELYTRCFVLSSRELFDKGAKSLDSLFSGRLPRKFEDMFAMIHVAFAAAYILHREHASHDWTEFFQDALEFHLALSGKSDRDSFLEVMYCWWQPPRVRLESSLVIKNDSVLRRMSQESKIGIQQADLLKLLKNGEVARNFSEFLDGFEAAAIKERNDHFLPGALLSNAQGRKPFVEGMINSIIDPLQKQRGIEAFRDQISEAEAQIHNGLLRNPREVEVMLLSYGKRDSRSPYIYERYHDCITRLCDTFMEPSDPLWVQQVAWRDCFYSADLNEILAVLVEVNKHRSIEPLTTSSPHTSVAAVIRPNESLLDPSPASSPHSAGSSTNSSPTSFTSLDSTTSFSGITLTSSTLTSPTATSQSSMSPTSPTSPTTSSTDISHCNLCHATFKGTPQHRRSNLQRHIRTSRIHNNCAGYKCPEVGCSSTLLRLDNLGKHLHTMHGISSRTDKDDAIIRSRHLSRRASLHPLETSLKD